MRNFGLVMNLPDTKNGGKLFLHSLGFSSKYFNFLTKKIYFGCVFYKSNRCYVGEGPTAQVWRSCNQRQIGSTPPVSYLHDRPPPKVHSLSNDEVASLSKDNALKFFKTSLSVPPKNNADFEDIDVPDRESSEKQEDIATKFDEKGSASTLNSTTEVFYGNNTAKNSEIPSASSRQGRASSKNPTFTIVEVRRSSSQ